MGQIYPLSTQRSQFIKSEGDNLAIIRQSEICRLAAPAVDLSIPC
jgi:hypothetical protein